MTVLLSGPACRFSLLTWLFLHLIAIGAPSAGEWKGKRVVKDGIVHVMNPAEPMEPPAIYDLKELWRLESETEDGELVFGLIDSVVEDDLGNIYALDSQLNTVHVISPDGEYLRSIGRGGEGPGEFRRPSQLFLSDSGLVGVADMGKDCITLLTQAGDPAGEWRPNSEDYYRLSITEAHPIPAGYVASVDGIKHTDQSIINTSFAAIYDHTGRRLTDGIGVTNTRARGVPWVFDEEKIYAFRLLGATENGRAIASTSYIDYSFWIFSADGSSDMVVERRHDPIRRDEAKQSEETSYWEGCYRDLDRERIVVSEFERTLWRVLPRDDDTFWVVSINSWTDLPVGAAETLDEFNDEGQFVRRIILRKKISPDDDLVYHLHNRILVFAGGSSSVMAAVGAVADDADDGDPSERLLLPAAICCELARVN
ncbi:6-bladed beta-propeller [Candidatus Eisenbacteria bacterium]|uniref:6-bladed beta-propeller n=1 Tax=Eiseniibacteriota bacterium TaxID=2212470 RepID=A0ABV6YLM0_UNCEI